MKNAKRALSLLLLLSLALCLVSCDAPIDRAERILREEGFTVTRYGEGAEGSSLSSVHEDLTSRLTATRDGEWLHIYVFHDEEKAIAFYGVYAEKYKALPNMAAAIDGCTVYEGLDSVYRLLK